MSLYDLFIQLIGLVAWGLLVYSYYKREENHIILFQVIATVLYCVHYYLLGAYSGLFVCMFEVVRDYLYYKSDADNYIFAFSIPIYIVYGYLTFGKYYDLFPIFASVVDGFTLIKKRKIIVAGAIVSYTLWVLYDLFVGSYSCLITDGIVVISNLSILLFDKELIKNNGERRINYNR